MHMHITHHMTQTSMCDIFYVRPCCCSLSTTAHGSRPPPSLHAAAVNGLSVWLHVIDVLLHPVTPRVLTLMLLYVSYIPIF